MKKPRPRVRDEECRYTLSGMRERPSRGLTIIDPPKRKKVSENFIKRRKSK
jgi:hypothetical protein